MTAGLIFSSTSSSTCRTSRSTFSTLRISIYARLLCALPLICLANCAQTATAQTPEKLSIASAATSARESLGDALENLGRVYQDSTDPVLQELWLLGRYHGQYHWTEATTGEDDGYESRRTRLGAQAKMFKQATFHAQLVSGTDIQPFYNGFTELWAQWSFSKEVALTIGQQKNRFTHDRNVSSRYLNYLERALVTNMFAVDYTPAITLQGTVKDATYYAGFFTNATGQNMGKAFADFDSGYSFLSALYYNLGTKLGVQSATVYGSYLHSDANENATNMNRFDDGLSTALILTHGHASLVTEVTGGIGSDSGNIIGLNLQPTYFINHYWQLVSRYQLALSDNSEGLRAQRRYERDVDMRNGDRYQAVYFGLDHYIAKHRLKLMTGLEYANMSGEHAWTASTMFRFYFGPHSGGAFPMNQILPLDYD